jgi:hypothetical protein
MEHTKILSFSFASTQNLIGKYKEYKQTEVDHEFETDELKKQSLLEKLQNISDSMKFDNPVIWMMYKHLAYKDTTHPITTVGDFIKHCEGYTDICSKRYMFLRAYLINTQTIDIESVFEKGYTLDKLYTSEHVLKLIEDSVFMEEWKKHEYNTADGKTAKWKSYNNHESCPCCN